MASKFKPGDIVAAIAFPDHKMVIEREYSNNQYGVYWQDKTGKKQIAEYFENTLELWVKPTPNKSILDDFRKL